VDVARFELHHVDLGDRSQTIQMVRVEHRPLVQVGAEVVHQYATLDIGRCHRRAGQPDWFH
jgi:hypothetical protein